ncbi:BF3164 family lipoprotein [Geofilum rubicundum]|uniref:BF3164 family lipoprotein n=1 Tax=Geofilum rubicundum TaxID=472113 RepID=UPI0007867242|nr:BF3164 family lipoprotein [Geofilum rubicundum]
MKNFLPLILASTTLLVVSCKNPKTNNSSVTQDRIILVDLQTAAEIETSDSILFPVRELIQLENVSGSILNRASKVLQTGERLLILDIKENVVLHFSDDGRFITKLSKEGRGPGEYNQISDICLNVDQTGYLVLDNLNGRILEYSWSNEHLSTQKIDHLPQRMFHRFEVLDKGVIALYSNSEEHRLLIYDTKNDEIIEQGKKIPQWVMSNTPLNIGPSPFFQMEDGIGYYEIFDQTIYKLSSSGISPLVTFDFSPIEFINLDGLKEDASITDNAETIHSKNWVSGIYQVNYSNNHLILRTTYNKVWFTLIYNVSDQEFQTFKFKEYNNVYALGNSPAEKLFFPLYPMNQNHATFISSWFKNKGQVIETNEEDNLFLGVGEISLPDQLKN